MLHPNKSEFFFDRWETARVILLDQLKVSKKITNLQDQAFVQLLPTLEKGSYYENFFWNENQYVIFKGKMFNNCRISDNQDTIIFYLLPYLVDGSHKRKRRAENDEANVGRPSRLTIQDRREAFIVHVEVLILS